MPLPGGGDVPLYVLKDGGESVANAHIGEALSDQQIKNEGAQYVIDVCESGTTVSISELQEVVYHYRQVH